MHEGSARQRVVDGLAGLLLVLLVVAVPLAHDRGLQEQTEPAKAALLGLGGLLLLGLALLARPRPESRLLPLGIVLALVLVGWQIATAPFAASAALALPALLRALELLAFLVAAYLVLGFPGLRPLVLAGLCASSFLAALFGLAQYEAAHPAAVPGGLAALIEHLRGLGPVGAFLAPLEQTDAPGSFFGHANVAAELVAPGSLIAAAFLLRTLLRGPRTGARLLLSPLAALVVGAGLLFVMRSGSRAVMAGVGLALLLVWGHEVAAGARRRPLFGRAPAHLAIHAALLAALAGGAALGLGRLETSPRTGQEAVGVLERLESAFDPENTTVRERLDLWSNTLAMIADRPVFGVGAGNFRIVYPEYADSRRRHEPGRYGLRRQPARPHNEYLAVLAESGWPGGLLFLGFLLAAVLPALFGHAALRREERPGEATAMAAFAGLVPILVAALFAFPLQQSGSALAFLVLLAILMRAAPGALPVALPAAAGRRGLVVLAVVLLVLSAAHHRAAMKASADLRRATSFAAEADPGPLGRDRALDQAIARAPGRDDLLLLRGQLDAVVGRRDEAAAAFERALAIHPALANAWMGLAGLRLAEGALEGARAALRRALRLQPRDSRLRIAAGDAYRSIGDGRAAWRAYEEALELATTNPDRLAAMLALAALHSDNDRAAAALHWLERSATLAPEDPVVLETRARFHQRHFPGSDRTAAAWAAFRAIRPGHAEANLRCGQAELAGGRPEEALRSFEAAFLADPELLVALVGRGRAQAALGRLAEARGTLVDCLRRAGLGERPDPIVFEEARALIAAIEDRAREQGLMEGER